MNVLVNLGKKAGLVPAPLVDTVSCLMRGRAILEANRLGIFTALADGPATALELATRLQLHPESTDALLTALASCDYLRKRGDRFANGPWVNKWILESGMGLCHFLMVQENVWQRAGTLGEVVRTGKPVSNPHEDLVAGQSWEAEVYVRGMKQIAQLLIPPFSKAMEVPPQATRLLDLGGSHGDFSRALVHRFPGLQATVMDLEGPVLAAKALAETLPDKTPITFLPGNLLTDPLGKDWDVALMVSVLHVFSLDQARGLFSKVAAALRPGGVFAVLDGLRGVSRARDNVVAMQGLNYLTMGGRSYHVAEVQSLMKEAGFASSKIKKLPVTVGTTLVLATR